MARQLHCIVHPNYQNQYYAIRDDGVLALYESGQRNPIKEYNMVEPLLIFEGYERIVSVGEDGNEIYTEQKNSALLYDKSYTMELVWPWMSVFEQYGTNGCVYHLETGKIRLFRRENYHADVSSFSNGLLIYKGNFCLLHQTEWNRLDVTDLETGNLLTDREIFYRLLDEPDEHGGRKSEKQNYKDYFHGRIFFSPDYRCFVDTGWVWQPEGVPMLYCLEDFLTGYENSEIRLGIGEDYIYGEDWDQSVVWLNNHTFLLNFFPDMELMEDNPLFATYKQGLLLQFNFENMKSGQSLHCKSELLAEEAIPFPFVPTQIPSYHRMVENQIQYFAKMLNVDLYWDEQEQLLIGTDKNELMVWDRANGTSYCMRYGNEKCFYSVIHHAAYHLPPWPGNFHCANIRELLKIAGGFHLTSDSGYLK